MTQLLPSASLSVRRTGTGAPVVLLHGLGRTQAMWDDLAPLADQFELLRYDLPCHGETPVPDGPFGIEDLSDQLGDILTEAEIVRARIVGAGLGGMIALGFAAACPARVGRLVLIDTTPALSEGLRDAVLTMPDAGPMHAAMARADLMDLAEEIYAPTLVLCAEGADLSLREGADFLARSIPHGRLAYVAGATVDCVAERPDWLMRVLRDFLA